MINFADNALPKGDYGVGNEYYNAKAIKPAPHNQIHNIEVSNLQWAMPKPKNL